MGPQTDIAASDETEADRWRRAAPSAQRAFTSPRRAFSLPELMIALVILGLGLLIIAAALPVGLDYNKQTADQANGSAASEYAFETVTQEVRLAARGTRDALFRPRVFDSALDSDRNGDPSDDPEDSVDLDGDGVPDNDLTVDRFYEPLVKVRNLPMLNVEATPGVSGGPREYPDEPEDLIARWLPPGAMALGQAEYDQGAWLETNPALAALARIYPPVFPDNPHSIASFFPVNQGIPSNSGSWAPSLSEMKRAVDRRLAWTAFYRRVAYPTPGPDRNIGTRDDIQPDPNLYEVIVVVTRRPTTEHRFLIQDAAATVANWPSASNFTLGGSGSGSSGGATNVGSNPDGPDPGGVAVLGRPHRAAPCAWLVWFNRLPTLNAGTDYDDTLPDRPLNAGFVEPASLTFQCSVNLGQILPVGSIFIPAVNDDWPTALNAPGSGGSPNRAAGFVPHAPSTLPIYKVIGRPDATTVVVENNGFYPWIASGLNADAWPVWIVPPAVRTEGGQKIFETTTSVVSVERRFIRFREIP